MTVYGITPQGFVAKPLPQILDGYQKSWLAYVDPAADLSPTTPEGQILAMIASNDDEIWRLAESAWNSNDRAQVQGAGLDNLGDISGDPREGPSYTQIYCTLTFTDSGTVHPPGTIIGNVVGTPALTFSNVLPVTSNGGSLLALMQATTIGTTPTINPGTLTAITSPVTGWSGITNPGFQSQLGSSAELDPAYVVRQQAEIAVQGSCTQNATAAALIALAAGQSPPVAGFQATVVENDADAPLVYSGSLVLPPHRYMPIVFDPTSTLTDAQIGQVVYDNKPSGIASYGTTALTVIDALLGPQTVFFVRPTGQPILVSFTIIVSPGFSSATVQQNVKAALLAAATAVTVPGGSVPNGQFGPGKPVIAAQLFAVVMSVPGVYDIAAASMALSPSPLAPVAYLLISPTQNATLALADITVTESVGP